jgi:integrase
VRRGELCGLTWQNVDLERDLAGPAYHDRDLVFCNELGQPIYPTRPGEWFAKRARALGLPGDLHTLPVVTGDSGS